MEDEADDILTSLDVSAADKKKYKTVLAKLDKYFIQRRNVIFKSLTSVNKWKLKL